MVMATSRFAYKDCYDVFDMAMKDPKGVRIKFKDGGKAYHFRHRLHTARRVDRSENTKIYEDDHPMYGKSEYDLIACRIGETSTGFYVDLVKIDAKNLEIESLSNGEEEDVNNKPAVSDNREAKGEEEALRVYSKATGRREILNRRGL